MKMTPKSQNSELAWPRLGGPIIPDYILNYVSFFAIQAIEDIVTKNKDLERGIYVRSIYSTEAEESAFLSISQSKWSKLKASIFPKKLRRGRGDFKKSTTSYSSHAEIYRLAIEAGVDFSTVPEALVNMHIDNFDENAEAALAEAIMADISERKINRLSYI